MAQKEYLYHYTKFETFVKYILPTKKIRFNLIKYSNDPFELREYTLLKDKYEGLIEFLKYLEDNSYLISFYCDKIKGMNNDVGALNSRMWSQYGDLHNGVCIKLNKGLLDNRVNIANQEATNFQIFKDYIKYSQVLKTPSLPNQLVINNFFSKAKTIHKALFYQKTKCWVGEKEYRYVKLFAPEANNGEDSFLDISGEAIEEIFFGKKIKKENLKNINIGDIDYSFVDFEWGQIIKTASSTPFK